VKSQIEKSESKIENPIWPVYLCEGLNIIGAAMMMNGIFFVMTHEHGWDTTRNLALAAAQGATFTIGALSASAWSRVAGKARGFVISSLLLAGCSALMLVARSTAQIVPILMAYALVVGTTWPVLESLVTSGVDARRMSRRVGIYNLVWSGLAAVVVAVFGSLLDWWPPSAMWIATLVHAGGAVVMWICRSAIAVPAPANLIPANGAHGSAAVHRSSEAVENQHAHLAPEPQLLRHRRQALWLSRIGLPASFVVASVLMPMMPGLRVMQELDVAAQTLVCSVWLAARWGIFAVLGATSWWHTRPWLILLAAAGVLASVLGVLLPPFQSTAANVIWMLGWEIVLGASMGMIFAASLYFGMVLSDGSTEHGGYHEALIGVGQTLGPAGAALGQYLKPDSVLPGAAWITFTVGSALIACAIVAWWYRREEG